ncbi:hypothetical protein [Paraconexibacter sp. AEG42_29]
MAVAGQDYRWNGEIGPLGEALGSVRPGATYSVTHGGISRAFTVAGRGDYEAALRDCGALSSDSSLGDHPELVAVVQAHWHASGSNGCRFAMYLSEHRERFGWETWVMRDRGTVQAAASAIAALTNSRIDEVEVDVLSFVLPHVTSSSVLGEIVQCLGTRDGWRVAEGGDATDKDIDLLGLTVGIELGFWSEVLGFGQGEPLAHTRRAPFTELAIRTKPPRGARSSKRAFMADVPLDADSATMGRWKKETKQSRSQRLGDVHDARGKAKWTTVVQRSTGG